MRAAPLFSPKAQTVIPSAARNLPETSGSSFRAQRGICLKQADPHSERSEESARNKRILIPSAARNLLAIDNRQCRIDNRVIKKSASSGL
jgi:hypothetical protein